MEKEESQLHSAETKCIFIVHPIVLMQPQGLNKLDYVQFMETPVRPDLLF